MTSRKADSMALVERCKKAGWEVLRATNGYKIRDASGGQHTIHLSYSDVRSLNNTIATLERAGLSEAEAAVKTTRLTATRTRATAAKAAAEKKAKELAATASLTKASGPYLVVTEDVDIEWFTTPHPAPWVRRVNITPAIARKLLQDHNADNRPQNKTQIKFYRDVILNGLWHLTHQGFAIDTRGVLQDGQHRLEALLLACEAAKRDVIVPFFVWVGMPVENFKTIDEGMLRNARQLFSKDGEKNASCLQTCVRLVYYNQDGDARRNARLKLPNQTIVDTFGADADEYRAVTRMAMRDYNKAYLSNSALAAAMYLIRKINGPDNEFVGQFYDGLITGLIPGTRTVLDDDDPRAVLRKKLSDIKLAGRAKGIAPNAMTQMGMVIATWNNCVTSRRPRALYFSNESAIPQPLRCIPGEGIRPDAFGTLVTQKAA